MGAKTFKMAVVSMQPTIQWVPLFCLCDWGRGGW